MRTVDPPVVICSRCGKEMHIEVFMEARMARAMDRSFWPNPLPEDLYVPLRDMAHECNHCGFLWFSSDALEYLGKRGERHILRWLKWR